jgi:hypothetical protein
VKRILQHDDEEVDVVDADGDVDYDVLVIEMNWYQ